MSPKAYNPEVRVVKDLSEKSPFTFGLIFNSYRENRPADPSQNISNCPLCGAVKKANSQQERVLDLESLASNWVIIPNKFPLMEGHSLAISRGTDENEMPMYCTNNLNNLATQIKEVTQFATTKGFQAFHNSQGAGASVPNHEHWHLTNWGAIFDKVGEIYGFEAAEIKPLISNSTGTLAGFPFAHIIFLGEDTERISVFIGKLERELGRNYNIGTVPHVICQGQKGYLVVPYKIAKLKGSIGSGDVAVHVVIKDGNEYQEADFKFCLKKLGNQLFGRDELRLERHL